MLFVAVACAIAAAVFLALWVRSSRALRAETTALDRSRAALAAAETEKAGLTDELAERERSGAELERLLQASQDDAADLERRRIEIETSLAEVREELEAARRASDDANARLATLRTESEETQAALEAARSTVSDQAEQLRRAALDTEAAQEALVAAEEAAAKRAETAVPQVLLGNDEDGEQLDVPGFSPSTAWELELVRSERTWRYSVATNPLEDTSPFGDTQNPLRLAIEIEALALREDVGAFIGIVWEIGDMIDPSTDPARAHLMLRLAQEMLAAAAREVEPSELRITPDPGGDGVSMQIVPVSDDDIDFNIPPPPIASEWIDIDEHGGMVVTVKTSS